MIMTQHRLLHKEFHISWLSWMHWYKQAIFCLGKWLNLQYPDVKLNIACMHPLACLHTPSLCVYYDLCVHHCLLFPSERWIHLLCLLLCSFFWLELIPALKPLAHTYHCCCRHRSNLWAYTGNNYFTTDPVGAPILTPQRSSHYLQATVSRGTVLPYRRWHTF